MIRRPPRSTRLTHSFPTRRSSDLPAAMEGRDLNPLLQDPRMIIHPPMLYLGYVGFVVPFAFAVAALIDGRMDARWLRWTRRSEEHTSELQSLMRISYAVFCLKKKKKTTIG